MTLFAAAGGLSAGAQWALVDAPSHLSPAAAQAFNLFTYDTIVALECSGIALVFICFGLAILQSAALPKWLGWVAFPFAVVAVIPPISFIGFVAVGLWTLIISIIMWRRGATTDTSGALASTPA